ncbi:MAG TPA: heme-binding protein [Candidatus Binatia bacterium]|nr:heme-binding protein [Candidatus Binatia bacterium]
MLKYLRCVVFLPLFVPSLGAQTPQLVIRGQVKLTAAGAERVVQAAKERAAALKVAENIAVVDDGGHLLAFLRMDGARPASADTAISKAISAATMRRETGPVFKGGTQEDASLNLAIEHAAAANGGKLTILYGGIPIVVEGQVIGAVGVGGGTEEQDVSVAKTAAAALEIAVSATYYRGRRSDSLDPNKSIPNSNPPNSRECSKSRDSVSLLIVCFQCAANGRPLANAIG